MTSKKVKPRDNECPTCRRPMTTEDQIKMLRKQGFPDLARTIQVLDKLMTDPKKK